MKMRRQLSSYLLLPVLLALSSPQVNLAEPSLPASHHQQYQQLDGTSFLSEQQNLKRQTGLTAASSITLHEDPAASVEILHLSLVSARGPLAFWRPTDLSPSSSSSSSSSSSARCFNLLAGSKISKQSAVRSSSSTSAELVAVEGTSVKLNIVIEAGKPGSHSLTQPNNLHRLKLDWTLNGWPLIPDGKQFSQQLINENDELRQFLSATAQVHQVGRNATGTPPYLALEQVLASSSSNQQQQQFMLAPFVDRQHLSRLLGQLADGRKPPSELLQQQSFQADDFLSEGHSIDWSRLESYLHDLKLASPDTPTSGQANHNCAQETAAEKPQKEQSSLLTIVQVELLRLSRAERGLYQLRACPDKGEGSATVGCRELSFALQVAEDIPVIVIKPEQQLLEPGERLSVRCVATGFTLPQITWYLDGQQLSEHPQQQQQQQSQIPIQRTASSSSMGLQLTDALPEELPGTEQQQQQRQSRLRIGDYVSADTLVHSFVNSSSVEPEDAGFYKCRANNGLHSVEHEARLDVRGPAMIARPLRNRSALAGQPHLVLQCPFSGSPILSVEWFYLAGDELGAQDSRGLLSRTRRQREFLQQQQDEQQEGDPEQDEWLSQASAMLTPPSSSPEEYPEPVPDAEYPGLVASAAFGGADYADVELDFQQQAPERSVARNRRQVSQMDAPNTLAGWLKFPQSRRSQVYPNGTLVIQEVTRQDQGFYRCRALGSEQLAGSNGASREALSNSLFLSVLVPPVISPFSSPDNLREGMRNFLTCSVIEGDSPVHLRWLKDKRPIEELSEQQPQPQLANRIRVETTNEFTSTLFFSHVDFKDNGNYTCMATNKAASVNYTARMLVNVPPKWIKAPKDLECVAGQSIVIDCQAQAYPSARVWWELGVYSPSPSGVPAAGASERDKGKLVAPSALVGGAQLNSQAPNHYRTIISNSRIHILENASLVIRDASKQDQGYYLCQAANNFGSLSSLIKLTVNVGASFSSKYLVRYAKVNERVELDCDPIGQSQVQLIWFMRPNNSRHHHHHHHQQQQHTQSIGANQLNSGSLNSSAIMMAAAAYDNLPSYEQQVPPNLQFPDSLGPLERRVLFSGTIRTEIYAPEQMGSIDASSSQQQQQLADQIAFLPATPPISFEVQRRPDGRGELVRLTIKQSRRFHSGDFVCQASNQYGADEKVIKLLVQEPPDPVEELSLVQVSSRSLSVSWTPPFNGNSPINSYTVEWAPASTQDGYSAETSKVPHHLAQVTNNKWSRLSTQLTSAQLTNLEPLRSYEIRVRAQNQLGQSALLASSPLIAQTSEEAPAAPPLDIQATPLSSSSIRVSWLPPRSHEAAGADILMATSRRLPNPLNTPPRLSTRLSAPPTELSPSWPNAQSIGGIKGYYVGYRLANSSSEPFVFKAVSMGAVSQVTGTGELNQVPEFISNGSTSVAPDKSRLGVLIGELKRNTRYAIIVQAFNSAGPGPQSDPVETQTLLEDPPSAAQIRAGLSTYTSIELLWSFPEREAALLADAGAKQHLPAPILGYQLFYRLANPEGSPWIERKLTARLSEQPAPSSSLPGSNHGSITNELGTPIHPPQLAPHPVASSNNSSASSDFGPFRFVLEQLTCGRVYQIYLVAYNSIGFGPNSQIVRSKTRGGPPIAPRRQDYILANSSWAQVNLDAWMDAGCSIKNFEIRYRRSERPASQQATTILPSIHQSDATPSAPSIAVSSFEGNDSRWLLLSNKLSTEQRSIELRDLEPETWYTIQTIAQSDAGQTQVAYSFMTLDKFGQVPPEAVETLGDRAYTGSGFPALFKSGSSSFRSIFYGNNLNNTSPLFISGCLCLILFATCSLFLVRRYNNLMKDTNSINSLQTAASTAMESHYGQSTSDLHNKHHHHHHHHHRHQPYPQHLQKHDQFIANQSAGHIYGSTAQEHYSLKVSPCKTTTTTILTGSSGNSSSQAMPSGSSICTSNTDNFIRNQTTDLQSTNLEQQLGTFMAAHPNPSQLTDDPNQLGFSPISALHRPKPPGDEYCRSPISPQAKFMTLSNQREVNPNLEQQHQLQHQLQVQFKTLPHRPLSSFVSQQQNNLNGEPCQQRYLCNQNMDSVCQQQILEEQQKQQMYSKLRLMYNSHSSYNICQNGHEEHQELPINALNDPIQPSFNTDNINLALIASQQNHQKLLAAANTLKRDQNSFNPTSNRCERIEQIIEPGSELTSLLMNSCQQQQQQRLLLEQNQNQTSLNYCHVNGKSNYNNYGMFPPSLNGSSVSTNNSNSLQETSSSVSTSDQQHNNSSSPSVTTPGHLIDIANGSSNNNNIDSPLGQQCQKTQHLKQLAVANQMNSTLPSQAQPTSNSNGFNNEQSDYALPFPPKWV